MNDGGKNNTGIWSKTNEWMNGTYDVVSVKFLNTVLHYHWTIPGTIPPPNWSQLNIQILPDPRWTVSVAAVYPQLACHSCLVEQ